ncbi:ATP-binding protein [Leptospira alexanderi]|uniref:ATP-binding protein n=1 Tax=Leptospira alexanderi TaxID=100053 RepID=UPI000991221D|nr:SbcC/MukB-like Walker B domain-containing protein [Leptospira alexanderi]
MSMLFHLRENELPTGFRMRKLEIFNWGTFNGKIWVLEPNEKNFLLTGANGSGKSTFVDAILTLLVHSNKRNYNMAGGVDTKKKDRAEKSYVEGHYGKEASGAEGIRKVRSKQEDCYSVLLSVFSEPEKNTYVTIAQVFWFQSGELNKFFLIADRPMSIQESLILKGRSIKDLKSDLKKDGVRVFDNFKAYASEFKNLVGLRSDKAIDLLNQIVSIKSLRELNEFVREHMLEPLRVNSKIEELDKSYSNLTETYQAIVKAREQLKLLEPIGDKAGEYREVLIQEERIEKILGSIVPYFAKLEFEFLIEEEKSVVLKQKQVDDQLNSVREETESLREEERKIAISLENNDTVRRMEDLKRKIEDLQKEKSIRDISWSKYCELASSIGLSTEREERVFYDNFRISGPRMEENERRKELLRSKRSGLDMEKEKLTGRNEQVREEIEHLQKNKDLLPQDRVRIRKQISDALNIPFSEIPYACELIQIKETEKHWRGAIERLLNSFGLRLLVPEKHYKKITDYVNRTFLGDRLVYSRMFFSSGNSSESPKNRDEVFYKLEIKPDLDKEIKTWLESQILRDYNYICCDMTTFYQQEKAITQSGLIKTGRIRHEKNDRSSVNDSRNYILGWNNQEKLEALQKEFRETGQKIYELKAALDELRLEENKNEKEFRNLDRFREFDSFSVLDISGLESDLERSISNLEELERSSKDYLNLKSQHGIVKEKLDHSTKKEKELEKALTEIEVNIRQNQRTRSELEQTLSEYPLNELKPYFEEIQKRTLDEIIKKEDLDPFKRMVRERFRSEQDQVQTEKSKITKDIVQRMDRYNKKFPEDCDRIGLIVEMDSLDAFEEELEKIRKERLPEFENRFKAMMGDKVTKQVTEFKSGLEDHVAEIQERIQELNESLHRLDYVKGKTYIQLDYTETKNKEIVGENGFKVLLKECIPDVGDVSSNEEKFQKIRELLDRLKAVDGNERWSKSVTDTRNWLDFRAVEYERETNRIKEVYDSSAGKSGGQTVKLAYTILASAIAYQFGFNNKKSFRFVVIDEMFNNLDGQNSKFALELFERLKLQLLVVTPMDKIAIVQHYVSSVHFVRINPEGNLSKVVPITQEELSKDKLKYSNVLKEENLTV